VPTEPDAAERPEPRFLDPDDGEWQAVKQQRNADGSIAAVRERWLATSSAPPYLSLHARYDPGMIVRRHGHRSPHVLLVLAGELWVGERRCGPGTHVELPPGAAFGPLRAGPDGAELFEVMCGDPRSWGDDPDAFAAALAAAGATALPDPPIRLPGDLPDERGRWRDG
jgi:hypothetical protein